MHEYSFKVAFKHLRNFPRVMCPSFVVRTKFVHIELLDVAEAEQTFFGTFQENLNDTPRARTCNCSYVAPTYMYVLTLYVHACTYVHPSINRFRDRYWRF